MNEFPESSVPAFRPPERNTRFFNAPPLRHSRKIGPFHTRLKYVGFPDFERDLNIISLTDESLFRQEVFGGDQGRSSVHLKHKRND